MSVVIETTLGDLTVDLFINQRPTACRNFLKLCKIKYYNFNLFHTISRGFIAQTGDPTGSRSGGQSVFGIVNGPEKRYFQGENKPRIKHTSMGLISFVGDENFMLGSQFFITLGEDLMYLDEKHCVFGEVVEGFDILEGINEVICDSDDRPYQDVRITHTVILDDPFPDLKGLQIPSRSPSPSAERLKGGRIAPDEEIDELEGKSLTEVTEMQAEREAKARATILEMVGDIPDADMAPPENVLFVCKLNPVTTDEDLEIIFNRFGKIKSCEVIRDRKTGDSLQYAFIEFETEKACEDAYFKMDNILIDDRRIHVDFSQSVSKVKWNGKGRGVTHYDEKGKKIEETNLRERNSTKLPSKHENTPKKSLNRDKYSYKEVKERKSSDNTKKTADFYRSKQNYDRGAYDNKDDGKRSSYQNYSHNRSRKHSRSYENNSRRHHKRRDSSSGERQTSSNNKEVLKNKLRYSENSDYTKKSSRQMENKRNRNYSDKYDQDKYLKSNKKKRRDSSSDLSSDSGSSTQLRKQSKRRYSSSSDSSSEDNRKKEKKSSRKRKSGSDNRNKAKKTKSGDSSQSETERKKKKR